MGIYVSVLGGLREDLVLELVLVSQLAGVIVAFLCSSEKMKVNFNSLVTVFGFYKTALEV